MVALLRSLVRDQFSSTREDKIRTCIKYPLLISADQKVTNKAQVPVIFLQTSSSIFLATIYFI